MNSQDRVAFTAKNFSSDGTTLGLEFRRQFACGAKDRECFTCLFVRTSRHLHRQIPETHRHP